VDQQIRVQQLDADRGIQRGFARSARSFMPEQQQGGPKPLASPQQ